jgi:hypothetical protein
VDRAFAGTAPHVRCSSGREVSSRNPGQLQVGQDTLETDQNRQSRIRRNVLLLAAIALAFYFGFIYMVYTRSP